MNRGLCRQTGLRIGEKTTSGASKSLSEDPRIKKAYLGAQAPSFLGFPIRHPLLNPCLDSCLSCFSLPIPHLPTT